MQENKSLIKKRWTPEEDQALRQIKQNLRYKSWSIISKKMATEFGFQGRSEKQCRDRYENYLKTKDHNFQWSEKEQAKLFEMFAKQGSKWQLISTYFSNIKGIHIKNKFYTRVRKAIRQLNSVIEFYFPKKFSPFRFSIISIMVSLVSKQVEEQKYVKDDKCSCQGEERYSKILFQLIQLTNQEGYVLFPQLQIKCSSSSQKKRLFKDLIKILKNIQKSNPNSNKFEQKFIQQKSAVIKSSLNCENDVFERRNPGEQICNKQDIRAECSYKQIQNGKEKSLRPLRIISRIKKNKFLPSRHEKVLQKQKQQLNQDRSNRFKQSDQVNSRIDNKLEQCSEENQIMQSDENQNRNFQEMNISPIYGHDLLQCYEQQLQFPMYPYFYGFQ